jgi:hypothetical protein
MFFCGCQRNSSTANLTVCVDEQAEPQIKNLIDSWKKQKMDTDIELVIIPQNPDTAEPKITQLRTEIMSGGGPDVFILSTSFPYTETASSVLFSNPQKSMDSDTFLPLDEYIENAEYMNTEHWNQTILASGRTEEGQMVLPMFYEYSAYVFKTEDLETPTSLPSSWEEVLTCKDQTIRGAISSNLSSSFCGIFSDFANYQKDTLQLSEADLFSRMQEAVSFYQKETDERNFSKAILSGQIGHFFSLDELASTKVEDHTIFALPNEEGGVTAYVTRYAAINKNTTQAEKAFELLDLLFSDEVMSNTGFKIGDRYYYSMCMPLLEGLSINNTIFDAQCETLSIKDAESLQKINNQINRVRYYSDLERTLSDLDLFGARDSNNLEERIAKAYDSMKMKVSE